MDGRFELTYREHVLKKQFIYMRIISYINCILKINDLIVFKKKETRNRLPLVLTVCFENSSLCTQPLSYNNVALQSRLWIAGKGVCLWGLEECRNTVYIQLSVAMNLKLP